MKKILIIDDDKDLSGLVRAFLVSKGFEVQVVNDPDAGLSAARKQPPDLILLDIVMPNKDGAEVARELRGSADSKDLPIIFLTGLVAGTDPQEGASITVEGVTYPAIAKPFETEKLLAMIQKEL